MLEAVHRSCDADGDGTLTADEMRAFLDRSRVGHLAAFLPDGELISFGEFKNFLLETSLLSLDADVAEYVVQAPLVCIVTEAWFDAADLDGDGRLTLDELERMFAAHGAGDAAAARRAFVAYDGDLSGFIDKPEYQRLLLGEHLLSVTTPSGGSIRPTPRL